MLKLAAPDAFRVTVPRCVPPSLKVTVPVGIPDVPTTSAEKVTLACAEEGLRLDVTVVVVPSFTI